VNIDTARLKEILPERRWFGGKGRTLDAVELFDAGIIEDGPPALALAIVTVRFADGGEQLYHLPLLVDEDGAARDAVEEPDRLRIFGELMAHGSSIKGDRGVFQFGSPALNPSEPPGRISGRVLGAEQSNTSIVLDEQLILKVFRKVEIGQNPDLELTRFLTNEGFDSIPSHLGEITYEFEDDGETSNIDLGLAQSFIGDAVDGWQRTLEALSTLYDAIEPEDLAEDRRFLIEQRAGELLESIAALGETTASLHVALSREETDPAFLPETIDAYDLESWATRAMESLQRLLDDGVSELQPIFNEIEERIDGLRRVEKPGLKTRVHGDYHLGQALHTAKGWRILDFEGEPARSLEERREKQSPLRDVAGMLRSFDYAATAALFARTEPGADEWARLEPWAHTWEELARERFLAAYLSLAQVEGRFLPPERSELDLLLDVFELDKALYELGYERSHRPDWVRIPIKGIRHVIERGEIR
jgi:trehalose synthase-fused probable maltokinase